MNFQSWSRLIRPGGALDLAPTSLPNSPTAKYSLTCLDLMFQRGPAVLEESVEWEGMLADGKVHELLQLLKKCTKNKDSFRVFLPLK